MSSVLVSQIWNLDFQITFLMFTNLDEAQVAEARHDLDAVPLGQLLYGSAKLGTLQVGGQPPDFVPVGRHFWAMRRMRMRDARECSTL